MYHRSNQAGFSLPHLLIGVLVIVLLGVAGWRVYDAQKQKDTKTAESTTTTAPEKEQPKEEYKVAEGYTVYENKALGFKFAYPTTWGSLESQPQSGLDLSLASKELGTNTITGKLEVQAASKQTFTVNVVYHGATVKPVIAGEAVTWQIVDAATQFDTFKVGDMYTPAPKVVFEKDSLKVYEFPKVHASGKWYVYVFRAGDRFVSIQTPQSNPSIDLPQAQFDAEHVKNAEVFTSVAKSVRTL